MSIALEAAVKRASIAEIQHCIASGDSPDATDQRGVSMLVLAICNLRSREAETVVRTLISAGANPNLISYCTSPLIQALYRQSSTLVRTLLELGADPNLIVEDDTLDTDTALGFAEFYYRGEVLELKLPWEITEEHRESSESWLRMLDKAAHVMGKRPPDELFLLWEFGGRFIREVR